MSNYDGLKHPVLTLMESFFNALSFCIVVTFVASMAYYFYYLGHNGYLYKYNRMEHVCVNGFLMERYQSPDKRHVQIWHYVDNISQPIFCDERKSK